MISSEDCGGETAGEDLCKEQGEPVTLLMLACQKSDIDTIRRILDEQPSAAGCRDECGRTALHWCVDGAGAAGAELVLTILPDLVDSRDRDGHTPLHLAVTGGAAPLAHSLLVRGADANAADLEGHTPVHWATVCGDLELLDLLLKYGGDISCRDENGAYPIHYAAQMCGPNSEFPTDVTLGLTVLKKLIKCGADVTARDNDGRTPLLWTASAETRPSKLYSVSRSADALLALVNAGASVSDADKDGLTALHCAASRGHTDCVESLLLLCGATINCCDCTGNTPLFYAVTRGHADCTQLLIEHGAWLDHRDSKGRTAAHCGAAKGQLETIKMLHRHKANLWIANDRGDLPLHEAVASGRVELIKWLLRHRPEAVNHANHQGRSALHIATINDNIEMCKVLIDLDADINAVMRSTRGQLMTPLDSALFCGNLGCARYLQLHGALPSSGLGSAGPTVAVTTEMDPRAFQTEPCSAVPPQLSLRSASDALDCSFRSQPAAVDSIVQTDWNSTQNIGTQAGSDRKTVRRLRGVSRKTSSTDRAIFSDHELTKAADRQHTSQLPYTSRTRSCSNLPLLKHGRTREGAEVYQSDYTTTSSDDYSPPFRPAPSLLRSQHNSDRFNCQRKQWNSSSTVGKRQSLLAVDFVDRNDIPTSAVRNNVAVRRSIGSSKSWDDPIAGSSTIDRGPIVSENSQKSSIKVKKSHRNRTNARKPLSKSTLPNGFSNEARTNRSNDDSNTSQEANAINERFLAAEDDRSFLLHQSKSSVDSNVNILPADTKLACDKPNSACLLATDERASWKHNKPFRNNHVKSLDVDLPSRTSHLKPAIPVNDNKTKSSVENRISKDLLEIKRVDLRTRKVEEGAFVKRLAEKFNSFARKYGIKPYSGPFNYTPFEKYLQDQLERIRVGREQTSHVPVISPVTLNRKELKPLAGDEDTQKLTPAKLRSTPDAGQRCHHIAHAYTGIPCVAYIKRPNHHCIEKPTARTLLPKINPHTKLLEPVDLQAYDPSKPLKLELNHAGERQTIQLPTHLLDKHKKYHVSFSIRPESGKKGEPSLHSPANKTSNDKNKRDVT